jgi:tetratricopeptide (TPR) repeat protein
MFGDKNPAMKKIFLFFFLFSINAFSQQAEIEKLQRRVDEQENIIRSMREKEQNRMVLYISISAVVLLGVSGFFMWRIKKLTAKQVPVKNEKPEPALVSEEKVENKKLSDDLGGRPDGSPRTVAKEEKLTAPECVQKGKAAYYREDYQQAMSLLTEAIKLNPGTSDLHSAYYYRGLSKYRLGNYNDSIIDFTAALVEEMDYVYFIRGTAYFFLDKLPEALKDMEKALEISPNYDSALEYKKDILDKMG